MAGPGDTRPASAKAPVGGTQKFEGPLVTPLNRPAIATLTVTERAELLIADAKQKFSCTMTLNQSKRTAEQAQQFHICHMFLYNMFKHLKPTHPAMDGRTISWEHLSDASVTWALITNPGEFLRTAAGEPAVREAGKSQWAKGSEPDKNASVKAMSAFLKRYHVTSMAAPGQNQCGEPCSCGGAASKHITGAACDVGGMALLQAALAKENGGEGINLDEFLKDYGLHRPMAHLTGKQREEWHVEALPPNGGKPKHHAAREGHGHPLAKHAGKDGLKQHGTLPPPATTLRQGK